MKVGVAVFLVLWVVAAALFWRILLHPTAHDGPAWWLASIFIGAGCLILIATLVSEHRTASPVSACPKSR